MIARKIATAAVALAALTGAAQAQSLPNYDVTATCRANIYVPAAVCPDAEYIFRSYAKDEWASASPAVRQECMAAANRSYETLHACLASHEGETP
jgi:hypothetical protein